MARKTMNRKRHRSEQKSRRTRRSARIEQTHALSRLATLIRQLERRRGTGASIGSS